jgi:hypothetical protein
VPFAAHCPLRNEAHDSPGDKQARDCDLLGGVPSSTAARKALGCIGERARTPSSLSLSKLLAAASTSHTKLSHRLHLRPHIATPSPRNYTPVFPPFSLSALRPGAQPAVPDPSQPVWPIGLDVCRHGALRLLLEPLRVLLRRYVPG